MQCIECFSWAFAKDDTTQHLLPKVKRLFVKEINEITGFLKLFTNWNEITELNTTCRVFFVWLRFLHQPTSWRSRQCNRSCFEKKTKCFLNYVNVYLLVPPPSPPSLSAMIRSNSFNSWHNYLSNPWYPIIIFFVFSMKYILDDIAFDYPPCPWRHLN